MADGRREAGQRHPLASAPAPSQRSGGATMRERRAYVVTTAIDGHREGRTVFAANAGKARYQVFADARELYPDIQFKDIRVRSLGPADPRPLD